MGVTMKPRNSASGAIVIRKFTKPHNAAEWLELVMNTIFFLCGILAIGCVALITVYMVISGLPAIGQIGIVDFLFGQEWASTAAEPKYGILPFILSSVYGTLGAVIIGIPIGLILGWLLGSVLVPVLMGTIDGEAVVSASPIIFIGSAVFAWVTVLISCLRPARLAGKVSPIEALRMSDADSPSKKKTKRRRGNASLASMAWANLWRNKKRTITVICSLTLGLVLLSSFYAKNAAFDMDKYLADLILADFELSDATSEDYINNYDPHGTTLTDSLVAQAEGQEGVEASGHLFSAQIDWQMHDVAHHHIAAC